jgi:hypothetical protein
MAGMGRREKAEFFKMISVTFQGPGVAVDLLLALLIDALKS